MYYALISKLTIYSSEHLLMLLIRINSWFGVGVFVKVAS